MKNNFEIYNKIITFGENADLNNFILNNKFSLNLPECFNNDEKNSLYIKFKDNTVIYNFLNLYYSYLKENFYYDFNFKNKEITNLYIREIKNNTLINYPNKCWLKDLYKFNLIYYFFDQFKLNEIIAENNDNNISLLMTACHELYHKWQFSSSLIMPLFYISNFFVSMFLGYETGSKFKWTIEGDVRKYVDNKENYLILSKIHNVLTYIKKMGELFTIKQHLDDNNFKILEVIKTLKFNELFDNNIEIKDTIDKYKNEEWFKTELENNYVLENLIENKEAEKNQINIKDSSEFKFILKILEEENILTNDFIDFLKI